MGIGADVFITLQPGRCLGRIRLPCDMDVVHLWADRQDLADRRAFAGAAVLIVSLGGPACLKQNRRWPFAGSRWLDATHGPPAPDA